MRLPKWLETRYSILWESFGDSGFRFEDALRVLQEKNKDRWEEVPVFLSELRKAGWLFAVADERDARQKVYRLKGRVEAVREVFAIEKGTLTRGDVDGLLKKAADLIRTRVDYKFILILLFLKRISDKWELEFQQAYEEALADGLSKEQARQEAKSGVYHDFDLPEEFLWDNIRKDVSMLPVRFTTGLHKIAQRNPELKAVIDSVDFIQFTSSHENAEILRQLMELFSEKKLQHVSPDILGDAYEWILRYFAPTKAKEGEIYTPREVIRLLIEILEPKPTESVYDPASGSAGMLISAYKRVEEREGREEADRLFLFGQEANLGILALAKMNLHIHNIQNCHLFLGDTLLSPKIKEGENFKRFDVVVANPPWNQDGYGEEVLKKGEFWKQRFGYGFATRTSADWAWIQHMIASADDKTGRVGIVIDNGCLFRGGREKRIRSRILEHDLVECVILLPEKLFYNTGAPGAILIFRENKPVDQKRKFLFINASGEFKQHPEVRKLNVLGNDNIDRIANVYRSSKEEKDFSRVVSLEEIAENDYNLNVPLYVMPVERREEIDTAKEFHELKELEREKQEITEKLGKYVFEIEQAD